jgi:hypothetical protein
MNIEMSQAETMTQSEAQQYLDIGKSALEDWCNRLGITKIKDSDGANLYYSSDIRRIYARRTNNPPEPAYATRSKIVALFLCFFLGYFGIHRFYVGKIGTGVLWLCTAGLFSIGWIVDIIMILTGSFSDNHVMKLR